VTDLILIYVSVTSSASVVRWLTLHSWTLNSSYEWLTTLLNWTELSNGCSLTTQLRLPHESRMIKLSWTELTSKRTECNSPCLTVPLLFCSYPLQQERAYWTGVQQWIIPCLFVAEGTYLLNRCLAMVIFITIFAHITEQHVKCMHCHHRMARPQVAGAEDGLELWRVAVKILDKQSATADKWRHCSSLWNVTQGLGLWRILWDDLSKRKWTWGFPHGILAVSTGQVHWHQLQVK
jgi:hypothetical protein